MSKMSVSILTSCRIIFFLFRVTAGIQANSLSAANPSWRHVITLILYTTLNDVIYNFSSKYDLKSFLRGEWFGCCGHSYRKLYKLEMKTYKLSLSRWWTKSCVESLADCLDRHCLIQLVCPDCCNCTHFVSSQHRFGSIWIKTVIIVWNVP